MSCPLLFRFRAIDRLPEPSSEAAARGTLVHGVLERIFDAPAPDRTRATAERLMPEVWSEMVTRADDLADLVSAADPAVLQAWFDDALALVDRWFVLEDPTRLEPADRELHVVTDHVVEPGDGVRLHGYVDRVDVAPDGRIRIVDYKSGRAPRPGFEAAAMFQLRFYALVLWRMRRVVPARLQLVYLGSGEVLTFDPDETDLRATERKVAALWQAIEGCVRAGDWRPAPSRRCDWCHFRPVCPAWGGTPPPLPDGATELEPASRRTGSHVVPRPPDPGPEAAPGP